MDKLIVAANVVQDLIETLYDPQSETKQISENLDVSVEKWRRHVTISLKNRSLFDEVLILITKDGYAGPNTVGGIVKKLTCVDCVISFDLNDNRYVTARVGGVYVPILFLE